MKAAAKLKPGTLRQRERRANLPKEGSKETTITLTAAHIAILQGIQRDVEESTGERCTLQRAIHLCIER